MLNDSDPSELTTHLKLVKVMQNMENAVAKAPQQLPQLVTPSPSLWSMNEKTLDYLASTIVGILEDGSSPFMNFRAGKNI